MWLLLRTCPRRGHKEPEGLEEEDGLESGQGGTPVPEPEPYREMGQGQVCRALGVTYSGKRLASAECPFVCARLSPPEAGCQNQALMNGING